MSLEWMDSSREVVSGICSYTRSVGVLNMISRLIVQLEIEPMSSNRGTHKFFGKRIMCGKSMDLIKPRSIKQ